MSKRAKVFQAKASPVTEVTLCTKHHTTKSMAITVAVFFVSYGIVT